MPVVGTLGVALPRPAKGLGSCAVGSNCAGSDGARVDGTDETLLVVEVGCEVVVGKEVLDDNSDDSSVGKGEEAAARMPAAAVLEASCCSWLVGFATPGKPETGAAVECLRPSAAEATVASRSFTPRSFSKGFGGFGVTDSSPKDAKGLESAAGVWEGPAAGSTKLCSFSLPFLEAF